MDKSYEMARAGDALHYAAGFVLRYGDTDDAHDALRKRLDEWAEAVRAFRSEKKQS